MITKLMETLKMKLRDQDEKRDLPPMDKQTMKFTHLRYKVIPLCNEVDADEFFEEVKLPKSRTYIADGELEEVAVFPYGGITAAFKVDPETKIANVGICKCNLSDVYNKHHGRVISSGRFEKMHNTGARFDTAMTVEVSAISDVETPFEAVRGFLIEEYNSGMVKDIERDMSFIRSYVASKTKFPFSVEIS